ncbi:carboxymuconolactone decarboxylase family protein [Pseudomonas sp. BF-R-19]|uniref:carboxymuconolactone decarboxylase family protein n=1 Tax=Pseudomonas sp. BF-R-19 TaxID=2832397 RepID=UPI001CBE99F5|nr:carboxymuconolactone decarboxylase family protein [Pseudomonas sp. BF-R-19]
MENNAKEAGRKVVKEMLGDQFLESLETYAASGQFGASSAAMALENVFGDIWARPGLDNRSRSLVTLGLLIAQGQPEELKNHVRAALANGLSETEIEEALMQSIPYAGFPAFSVASRAALEVLQENGLTTAPSATDRGLFK